MKKWCCCFVRIIIKSNNLSHRSYENWLKWCLCHCSSVVYAHKRFDAWEECVKIKLCLCCRHHNNASKLFSILYSMFTFSIEPKWLQNLDVVDCVSASQRNSVVWWATARNSSSIVSWNNLRMKCFYLFLNSIWLISSRSVINSEWILFTLYKSFLKTPDNYLDLLILIPSLYVILDFQLNFYDYFLFVAASQRIL